MPTRGLRPSLLPTTRSGNWLANLTATAATFVSTFAGLWLGRILYTSNHGAGWEDVFWPETGCSLALVALLGYRRLPWMGLGSLLALACFHPPSLAWLLAPLFMCQAGVGLWAIRRIHPNPQLRPNVRSYIVVGGVGGILVALPSSLLE